MLSSASTFRVFGSISIMRNPSRPPHNAIKRPWASKLTVAHSRMPYARDVTDSDLPNGPVTSYASELYGSLCMLLRPFGATHGLRGTIECWIGRALTGPPTDFGTSRSVGN